jgi:tellurite resistance protein
MSESPAASASIEIGKPAGVVRAQFFDVDHAIRGRIHHGVSLRWLPPATPGERRVEQEIKILSRSHIDIFVVEEGEGGAWVKRMVAGPNEGTRFVATFTPLTGLGGEPDPTGQGRITRVRMEAFVGPGGYFTGVGKLSHLGLVKSLERTLEEHRRALDGYEPGRARGAVRAVLEGMKNDVLTAPGRADGRAVMTNLLEAACVVAIADGHADDAERDVIQEVARTLCFLDLERAAIDRVVEKVAGAVQAEGIEQRCDKIAGRLASLGLGEAGLAVAVLVAQVSHGVDVAELAALGRLAWALGIPETRLADLIHHIDEGLSGQGG